MKTRLIALALLIMLHLTSGALAQETNDPLVSVFTATGACLEFHDDMLLTDTGLFDIATQTQIIAPEADQYSYVFSPTGRWFYVDLKIYDTQSGTLMHEMPNEGAVSFSLDDRYADLNGYLYDTSTWTEVESDVLPIDLLFRIDDIYRPITYPLRLRRLVGFQLPQHVSPDGRWYVVASQGIFDITTGEPVLDLPEPLTDFINQENSAFSPDGRYLFVNDVGAFDSTTWEQTYAFPPSFQGVGESQYLMVNFSPDGRFFAKIDWGVFDTATGEQLFAITGGASFSADGTRVATLDGVYTVPEGKQLLALDLIDYEHSPIPYSLERLGRFSPDNTLLERWQDGVYDIATGEKRFVFDSSERYFYFDADSSRFLVTTSQNETRIHDTATGNVIQTLPGSDLLLGDRWLGLYDLNDQASNCTVYERTSWEE
jgi:hypothetical protein